jgi:hypothetical protein
MESSEKCVMERRFKTSGISRLDDRVGLKQLCRKRYRTYWTSVTLPLTKITFISG